MVIFINAVQRNPTNKYLWISVKKSIDNFFFQNHEMHLILYFLIKILFYKFNMYCIILFYIIILRGGKQMVNLLETNRDKFKLHQL